MSRLEDGISTARSGRIDPSSRPCPALLTGPRVQLRPLRESDLLALSQIIARPGVAEWWPMESPESLRDELLGDEETVSLAIEYDDGLIGVVAYTEELWTDYFSVGLDIAIDPDRRGQGLGPETLRVVLEWLFGPGGHHRATIDPALANASAIRAYEKVGFQRVGVMREYERGPNGEWHDSLLMDLLASELPHETG